MLVPPMPVDELQRLAALRSLKILDTPREERFDRITRLATKLFQVPIALISLVDEQRQWFKSCQGLAANETSRQDSFCGHAILQDDLFIIPDARLDPRFADNPLVVGEPFVRFYAGSPIHDINGNKLGTLCLIDSTPRLLHAEEQQALQDMSVWVEHEINITRFSQAFIAQRESEARLQALMDSTCEAMLLVSTDQYFLSVNQTFCDFFGLSKEKIIGQSAERIDPLLQRIFDDPQQIHTLTVDMIADTQRHLNAFVQQKWPFSRELELFTTPVYMGSQHIGRLFVFRDVTHERELDRMKSEFVSMVSHELRSPLTAIKGYIDLFVEGNVGSLTPMQQHLLNIVLTNTDRLITLINDLLDLSRLESGRMELRRTMVDPVGLVRNIMDLLRPQFDARQQKLTFEQLGPTPQTLADPPRIEQVLTNILANAHNYTPIGGKINVSIHADERYITINVEDNGIGLSRDEQAHIFTRFYRAQNGLTEYTNGTGLGLTISRAIIEAHQGHIEVVSTLGQGSTFSILLPTVTELRHNLIDKAR